MNSSEKRRQKLLEQTRRMYSDRGIPAVHPRYGMAYDQLYAEEGEASEPGTFGIRVFLSILLFAMFVSMDYKGSKVMNVSSDRIVEEISMDLDVEEVWQEL